MASFIKSIEDIRSVNWAPKHLWDVKFDDSPKHFSQLTPTFKVWVPVSDVTIDSGNLETHSFNLANQSFEIPISTSSRVVTMTFFDSENYDIFKWLRNWMNRDILNLDKPAPFVSRLEQCCKTLYLNKLNSRHEVVDRQVLLVFPKQSILWEGNSQPAAQQYSVTFVVAGDRDSQQFGPTNPN